MSDAVIISPVDGADRRQSVEENVDDVYDIAPCVVSHPLQRTDCPLTKEYAQDME